MRSVQGRSNLRPNERLEFTPDAQFRYYKKEASGHVLESEGDFGANRRQIDLEALGLVFDYEVRDGSELLTTQGAPWESSTGRQPRRSQSGEAATRLRRPSRREA